MIISQELLGDLFTKYGKELKKGEILFQENEEAKVVYVVISGKIKISRQIKSGNLTYEKILTTVSAGEILGEMALLRENAKRSASAYVVEDSKILVIDKNTFYAMIRYNAEFSIKLMERLSNYVIRNNRDFEEIAHSQRKLLIIDDILTKLEDKPDKTLTIDNIIGSENIKGDIDIKEIENIIKHISKTEAINFDGEKITVNSIDLLHKFRILLSEIENKRS
jgi:TATA-box binding protein (TBP) (component of TFIID and TFIIIB)